MKTGAILGVDAAWTEENPSGVALAVKEDGRWVLKAVASSYWNFHALADSELTAEECPSGSIPDGLKLAADAKVLCGREIGLIAVDMPLAREKITTRRAADQSVSKAYGARQCGTHTPNPDRPGRIGETLHRSFEDAGYPLQTQQIAKPGLIEVYPHPALVELSGAKERHPYKVAKTKKYWPELSLSERRAQIIEEWKLIIGLLDAEIDGVSALLPLPESQAALRQLKAFEDALDAVICAWTAICAFEGRAQPFGDETSAIWVPVPHQPLHGGLAV